jgi:hypothetical protein
MDEEIWAPIAGYEDLYEVSNMGRFRSLPRIRRAKCGKTAFNKGKILAPQRSVAGGYLRVALSKDGKVKDEFAHRIVAKAFLQNPEGKPAVNHDDGDKTNNKVSNLEWSTHKENMDHAVETGLHKGAWRRLTDDDKELILTMLRQQKPLNDIAKAANCSRCTIERYKHRTFKGMI